MRRHQFTRPIAVLLILTFVIQAFCISVHASSGPVRSGSNEPRPGLISDYGLTLVEIAADCYLDSPGCRGALERLRTLSEWPSEKLLEAVDETWLRTVLGIDHGVHALTDPSVLVGREKEIKDYYRTILICLILEENERYDDEKVDEFLDDSEDFYTYFKDLVDHGDTMYDISDAESREDLKEGVKESLMKELDIGIPLDDILDQFFLVADSVKDFAELCMNMTAMCQASERDKALLEELAGGTNDALLSAALLEIRVSMEGLPLAVADAFADTAADVGMKAGKKVLKEAYQEAVLSALPYELRTALLAGTAIGDIVVSGLFSNDDMEDSLLKLECVGEMARVLISASEKLEKRYDNDRKGFDAVKTRADADLFVRSVEALYSLRKLSCDYSEGFADNALDATGFEKLIRVFDNKADVQYKDFLDKLATDKQNVLQDELTMNIAPLNLLWGMYPDEYAARKIGDMSLDDYIEKLQDDYQKEIDDVPVDYAPDGISDIKTHNKKKSGGSSKPASEKSGEKSSAKNKASGEKDKKTTGKTASDSAGSNPSKKTAASESSGTAAAGNTSPFDDFLNDKEPAYIWNNTPAYLSDLQDPEKSNGFPYEVGPQLDLDNDGENELILTGMYGGMVLDASGGKITVLTEGMGTAGVLCYGKYEGKYVICHKDTGHAGRQEYDFTVYQGGDTVVESFSLTAEYWDGPDPNKYSEDSTFTFKGQAIGMQEYEKLLREIFG